MIRQAKTSHLPLGNEDVDDPGLQSRQVTNDGSRVVTPNRAYPRDLADTQDDPYSATAAIGREESRQGRLVTQTGLARRRIQKPNVYKRIQERSERFLALENWEGSVEEVTSQSFTARVISSGSPDEEYVEIPLDEVSVADLRLVQEGAAFYWAIGYSVTSGGQRTRASLLRFRRTLAMSARDDAYRAEWISQVESAWLG